MPNEQTAMQSQIDDFDVEGAQHLEEGNESNAALLQLQDAFVSALTSSGALGKIRAELRATALSLIRGDEDLQRAAVGDALKPASLSTASKISLLLVFDFLQHHQLRQTAGVLEVEGGVHLLSNEQDALLGDLQALPGKGPLLERLVESFDKSQVAGPSFVGQSKSSHDDRKSNDLAASHEKKVEASKPPSTSVEQTTMVSIVLPDNKDVLREYEAYEASVAFSDVDGALDTEQECDEVEEM